MTFFAARQVEVSNHREEVGRLVWWLWFLIALSVGILEIMSVTFVLLWIAVGALLTTVFALFVHNIGLQLLLFASLSTVLFVVTRPFARRWRGHKTIPDRNDTLVGLTGVVVTSAPEGELGTVRIHGELWSAVAHQPLYGGQTIRVVTATATVLTVEPMEEPGPQASSSEWSRNARR